MALTRVKVWVSGEILTASDLNGEFNNILNNPSTLVSPWTANQSANGFALFFDTDANSGLQASVNDRIDISLAGTILHRFNTVASAVNGLDFHASATGVRTRIAAFGTDANIDVDIVPKGTGRFRAGNVVMPFDVGTRMVFHQTAAPTGWTKDTTASLDNSALRIVTGAAGSGGADGFSAVFAASKSTATDGSSTSGSTILDSTMIPSHLHAVSITSGLVSADHTHSFSATTSSDGSHQHGERIADSVGTNAPNGHPWQSSGTAGTGGRALAVAQSIEFAATPQLLTDSAGAHTHTVSGTSGGISANHSHLVSGNTGNTGGGLGHTHSTPAHSHTVSTMNLKFQDIIIASKA